MSETKSQNPDIPTLNPVVVQVAHSSNEFNIALATHVPVFNEIDAGDGDSLVGKARVVPIGLLKMSPQTAKDLLTLLQQSIQAYESDFGTIRTGFLERLKKEREQR